MKQTTSKLLKQARQCQCKELPAKLDTTWARVYPNVRACLLYVKYNEKGELVHVELTSPYDPSCSTYTLKAEGKKSEYLSLYRALINNRIVPEKVGKSKGKGFELLGFLHHPQPGIVADTFRAVSPLIQAGTVMLVPLTATRSLPTVNEWVNLSTHSSLGMLTCGGLRGSRPLDWIQSLGKVREGFLVSSSGGLLASMDEVRCFRLPRVQPETLCVVKMIEFTLTRDRKLKPILHVSMQTSTSLTTVPLQNFQQLRDNHVQLGSVIALKRGERGGLIFQETVAEEGHTILPTCPSCNSGALIPPGTTDAYCGNDSCRGIRVLHLHHALNQCMGLKSLSYSKVESLVIAGHDLFSLLKLDDKGLAKLRHIPGIGINSVDALERSIRSVKRLPEAKLADMSGAFAPVGMVALDEGVLSAIFNSVSLADLKALPTTGKIFSRILGIQGIGQQRALSFIFGWPAFLRWHSDINIPGK